MSLFTPCSVCQLKKPGKYASLYSAWFNGNDERVSQRQRYCLECLGQVAIPLIRAAVANGEDTSLCAACGEKSDTDMHPIYCTLYLPKDEPREYLVPVCDGCIFQAREHLQQGAIPLADRGAGVRGPSPSGSPDWATRLGL